MKTLHLAGCIIQDKDGRILLLHRNTPKRTHWEVPGGAIEDGESAEVAARRELQEELGVEVTVTRQIGARSFSEDEYRLVYSWFAAEITSGEPTLMEPDEYDAHEYLSIGDMVARRSELSGGAATFLRELEACHLQLLAGGAEPA